jgi:hypothetical protein
MAGVSIDTVRDESMLFADLKRDRPVGPEVGVRSVEQPEAHREAHDPDDKRTNAKRVLSERECG